MFDSLKRTADAWLERMMSRATDEYIQKYATDKNGKVDPKLEKDVRVEAERDRLITKSLYWDEPIMWAGVSAAFGFASTLLQKFTGLGNGHVHKNEAQSPESKKDTKTPLSLVLQGAALASLSAAAINLVRIPQRADKSFRSRIESKMEAQKLEVLLTEQQTTQISP